MSIVKIIDCTKPKASRMPIRQTVADRFISSYVAIQYEKAIRAKRLSSVQC